MNNTIRTALVVAVLLLCYRTAKAQNSSAIKGWDPLPDSLFLIWNLEQDQVRRLRVIEEDHEMERRDIMANKALNSQQQQEQLEKLAVQRRSEIKAVLQLKQFEDWARRSRSLGLK